MKCSLIFAGKYKLYICPGGSAYPLDPVVVCGLIVGPRASSVCFLMCCRHFEVQS